MCIKVCKAIEKRTEAGDIHVARSIYCDTIKDKKGSEDMGGIYSVILLQI
jgi:hypothetical protein